MAVTGWYSLRNKITACPKASQTISLTLPCGWGSAPPAPEACPAEVAPLGWGLQTQRASSKTPGWTESFFPDRAGPGLHFLPCKSRNTSCLFSVPSNANSLPSTTELPYAHCQSICKTVISRFEGKATAMKLATCRRTG